jgi:hypothetical protein
MIYKVKIKSGLRDNQAISSIDVAFNLSDD